MSSITFQVYRADGTCVTTQIYMPSKHLDLSTDDAIIDHAEFLLADDDRAVSVSAFDGLRLVADFSRETGRPLPSTASVPVNVPAEDLRGIGIRRPDEHRSATEMFGDWPGGWTHFINWQDASVGTWSTAVATIERIAPEATSHLDHLRTMEGFARSRAARAAERSMVDEYGWRGVTPVYEDLPVHGPEYRPTNTEPLSDELVLCAHAVNSVFGNSINSDDAVRATIAATRAMQGLAR